MKIIKIDYLTIYNASEILYIPLVKNPSKVNLILYRLYLSYI